MTVKMKPEDAFNFRKALEPATHPMVSDGTNDILLASIAISLKRIADVLAGDNQHIDIVNAILETKAHNG